MMSIVKLAVALVFILATGAGAQSLGNLLGIQEGGQFTPGPSGRIGVMAPGPFKDPGLVRKPGLPLRGGSLVPPPVPVPVGQAPMLPGSGWGENPGLGPLPDGPLADPGFFPPGPGYAEPPPGAMDDAAPLLTALIGLVLGLVLGSALAQSAQPQLPPYPLPPPPALYAPYTPGQIPMGQGPLSQQLPFVPFAPLSSGAGAVPLAPGSSGSASAVQQPAVQVFSQWQQFVQDQQRAFLAANTSLQNQRGALSQAQAQLDSPGKAQAVLAAQQQVQAAENLLNQLQLRQQSDRSQYRANLQSNIQQQVTTQQNALQQAEGQEVNARNAFAQYQQQVQQLQGQLAIAESQLAALSQDPVSSGTASASVQSLTQQLATAQGRATRYQQNLTDATGAVQQARAVLQTLQQTLTQIAAFQ